MRTPRSSRRQAARRGTIIPIVGVIMLFLTGMLAVAFDIGRLALIRTQLQNEADAAALAGASALGTDNLIQASPDQTADFTSARARAQFIAQSNVLDLNGNRVAVLDKVNDVTFGLLTAPSVLSQSMVTAQGAVPFNSVKVSAQIDATHGGNLNYSFATVFGFRSTTIQTSATATVEVRAIDTLKAIANTRSPILPITMSKSDWQAMYYNASTPDNYSYDPVTNAVTSGPDGLREQYLYPGSNASSSNNGLIQFGTNSRSNSVLQDQIVNGPTYAQMVAEWAPNGSPPWSAAHTFTIGADPGWRANTFDDLDTVRASGDARLIPINDGSNPGNGANGNYTIVAFAPVRVVYANKGGKSNGYALVQPAVISDPTVTASTTAYSPSGQGGVPVVRLTR